MTITTTPLAPLDVASRLGRLRAWMHDQTIDALLVTRLTNIRYLTGFTGSAATLLVGTDRALFVTDGRYRDQSAEELAAAGIDAEIAIGVTLAAQRERLVDAAREYSLLALEDHDVTWAQQREFASAFA